MPEAMQFKSGDFCWHELMTPDAEAAKKFYGQLFGWKTNTVDMGGFKYTLLSNGGPDIGGMMGMSGPEWTGVPPHWMLYVAVDDVDATCKKITDLGGKVCVPPTDISVGRFAVVNDPQGATFSVFKGKG